MLIVLNTGKHNFKEPREVFDNKGNSKGENKRVGPGDIFDVSKEEFAKLFHYRASEHVVPEKEPEIVYEAKWLKDNKTVKELKVLAKGLGCKGYSNKGETALIKMVLGAAPSEEDEDLTPSEDWGEDRLKAYLDEAGAEYEEDATPEDLLALALAHSTA